MPEKKYSLKTDFTMLAILMIPIAVAVNFVGGQLALALKLPVYLDTIGTVLAAILCGPWVGAATGLVTNLIMGISDPISLLYAPVNIAVGLVTGFCARKGGFSIQGGVSKVWWKWVISIFLVVLISIVTSAPITVMLGGVTSAGSSLIVAVLLASGSTIWEAVIGAELPATILDRVIAVVLTFLVIKVMPSRTLIKFTLGEYYIKTGKDAEG